jgi:tetratricopeptide (TPR) repeat protein
MEDKFKGLGYWEIVELLNNCKNLDEEMDIYKKLVELGEKTFIELQTGETDCFIPIELDYYACPMDNLALCYMKQKEYAKALPLLERALLLYRMLEITDSDFTYQRYNALKKLVKCHKVLGNKTMAILYEHEQRLLEATSETLKNDCKGSKEEGEL